MGLGIKRDHRVSATIKFANKPNGQDIILAFNKRCKVNRWLRMLISLLFVLKLCYQIVIGVSKKNQVLGFELIIGFETNFKTLDLVPILKFWTQTQSQCPVPHQNLKNFDEKNTQSKSFFFK